MRFTPTRALHDADAAAGRRRRSLVLLLLLSAGAAAAPAALQAACAEIAFADPSTGGVKVVPQSRLDVRKSHKDLARKLKCHRRCAVCAIPEAKLKDTTRHSRARRRLALGANALNAGHSLGTGC